MLSDLSNAFRWSDLRRLLLKKVNKNFFIFKGQLNEQNAINEILNKYVELGGNCLDTGNFFPWIGTPTEQTAEKYIGSWLKK